jgi:branched-chain amino acid transport system permease protein
VGTFLDGAGVYNFALRDGLIMLMVGFSIYVLLRGGLFALPQVGFMAVGAYGAAITSDRLQWSTPAQLVVSVVAGAAIAFLLALFLARLDGLYLAIGTIAFSEIVRILATNLSITGGAAGIVGLELSSYDHVIVGSLAIVALLLYRLARTRFGLAIDAMREDSLMAAHQGIDLVRYRISLFVLSGAIAGFAGGLEVHNTGFITPGYFDFALLTQILAAVIVGGLGSVVGAILGSALLFSLPEMLTTFGNYRAVFSGVILVVVMLVAPDGLIDIIARLGRWGRSVLARDRAAPTVATETVGGRSRVDEPQHLAHDTPPGTSASGSEPGRPDESLLSVRELTKSFGGLTALKAVTLSLGSSEVLGIIGPNGSGKTTFLNVLSGVYRPDGGTGDVLGSDLTRLWGRPDRVARVGLARTFQHIRLLRRASVWDNVAVGGYLTQDARLAPAMLGTPASRRDTAALRESIAETLDWMGLAHLAQADALSLPYGEQRKVEIARALVRGPRILMLDEPTAGMSRHERDEIFALVRRLRQRGVGVVVVEHDVESITMSCDRIAVLDFGQLIALGTPDAVMREEAVIDAYIGRRTRA